MVSTECQYTHILHSTSMYCSPQYFTAVSVFSLQDATDTRHRTTHGSIRSTQISPNLLPCYKHAGLFFQFFVWFSSLPPPTSSSWRGSSTTSPARVSRRCGAPPTTATAAVTWRRCCRSTRTLRGISRSSTRQVRRFTGRRGGSLQTRTFLLSPSRVRKKSEKMLCFSLVCPANEAQSRLGSVWMSVFVGFPPADPGTAVRLPGYLTQPRLARVQATIQQAPKFCTLLRTVRTVLRSQLLASGFGIHILCTVCFGMYVVCS